LHTNKHTYVHTHISSHSKSLGQGNCCFVEWQLYKHIHIAPRR
jgi:hypothetical protein